MFVPGKRFQPCLMFESFKSRVGSRSLYYKTKRIRKLRKIKIFCSKLMSLNLFGETLAYYYESIMFYTTGPWPRLEKPARDSSLLLALVNYGCKTCYKIDTRRDRVITFLTTLDGTAERGNANLCWSWPPCRKTDREHS